MFEAWYCEKCERYQLQAYDYEWCNLCHSPLKKIKLIRVDDVEDTEKGILEDITGFCRRQNHGDEPEWGGLCGLCETYVMKIILQFKKLEGENDLFKKGQSKHLKCLHCDTSIHVNKLKKYQVCPHCCQEWETDHLMKKQEGET